MSHPPRKTSIRSGADSSPSVRETRAPTIRNDNRCGERQECEERRLPDTQRTRRTLNRNCLASFFLCVRCVLCGENRLSKTIEHHRSHQRFLYVQLDPL